MMHPNDFFGEQTMMHGNDTISLKRSSSLSEKMHKMQKEKKVMGAYSIATASDYLAFSNETFTCVKNT